MDTTGVLVSVGTIVGTLVLCGIIVWLVIVNTKKQAYTGIVIKKTEDEREGANDDTYLVYTLIVKTDDGKNKSVTLNKKLWESFKEGDRIIKEAGKFSPRKV